MTNSEFLSWVSSPSSMKCILVEVVVNVGGSDTTRYLSNCNYVTRPTDTPANQVYLPVLAGSVSITEKLNIEGSASLSFGDIELVNNGELDTWMNDVWNNRSIKIFVGDVTWIRSDFRQIFDGTVNRLDSRARNTLNIALRDKLERLNTAMSDTRLGGTTDNKDRLIPLCFGEVHNIEPLLINPSTLTYQVHNGAIESIIEVRDNGVPVTFTPNLAAGTFTLAATPAGVITASVQGDKTGGTYRNTIGALIPFIVTTYGKSIDRFTTSDIDTSQVSTFSAANSQPVGLYLTERTNVLEVCAMLASSVGAQVVMSRTGLLRILKISLSSFGTPTVVTADNMIMNSLHPSERLDVRAAVKIAYAKNWTVQTNLQTGIPEAHKNLFEQEWLSTTQTDSTVATLYRLNTEPEQEDTLLLTTTDASTEATRRLNIWKVQRNIWTYDGTPDLMLETLGNYQTLYNSRFGMQYGITGQIVGISQDWASAKVTFDILA